MKNGYLHVPSANISDEHFEHWTVTVSSVAFLKIIYKSDLSNLSHYLRRKILAASENHHNVAVYWSAKKSNNVHFLGISQTSSRCMSTFWCFAFQLVSAYDLTVEHPSQLTDAHRRRVDCYLDGYATESRCTDRGCLWETSIYPNMSMTEIPWCFFPDDHVHENRVDCHTDGIPTMEACHKKNCIWEVRSYPNGTRTAIPACFYPPTHEKYRENHDGLETTTAANYYRSGADSTDSVLKAPYKAERATSAGGSRPRIFLHLVLMFLVAVWCLYWVMK